MHPKSRWLRIDFKLNSLVSKNLTHQSWLSIQYLQKLKIQNWTRQELQLKILVHPAREESLTQLIQQSGYTAQQSLAECEKY